LMRIMEEVSVSSVSPSPLVGRSDSLRSYILRCQRGQLHSILSSGRDHRPVYI
jgi:hypothetical protein